jgi:mannose-6-phosphate isomerase-like protein (cupin superfamily)
MSEIAVKSEHVPVYQLEQALKTLPQVEIPVRHDFCAGLYARTIFIPAGTVLTGAVHKHECFFVLRSGTLIITTDAEPVKAEAGFMTVTSAGSKRAGIALTDVVVTTFHTNPEELRDPDAIWDYYTEPVPDNLISELQRAALEEK